MSSPPRVSVVVPSYNHREFVVEAVQSALDQELPGGPQALEVVVVDDGSRDDSVERLRTIDDPRLRLEVQENRGAHLAFARGFELARGEILFLLNSDDVYAPGRIARLLDCFDEDPSAMLASTWLRIVDGEGQELGTKHGWHDLPPWPAPRSGPKLAHLHEPALALLESNWVSTTSNLAFRRSALDRASLLDLRYCHDWDFLLSLCHLGRMAVVEEALVDYRVHSSNTIKEGGDEEARGEAGGGRATTGQDTGQGAMRFEILWLLARHAERLLRGPAGSRFELGDLRHRLWNSLPRFGAEPILCRLLALRGATDEPPAAFDRLLDRDHPFRRRAIRVLNSSGEPRE